MMLLVLDPVSLPVGESLVHWFDCLGSTVFSLHPEFCCLADQAFRPSLYSHCHLTHHLFSMGLWHVHRIPSAVGYGEGSCSEFGDDLEYIVLGWLLLYLAVAANDSRIL